MDNKFKKDDKTLTVTQPTDTKSADEYKKKFTDPKTPIVAKKPLAGSDKSKGIHQPVGKPGMSQAGMNIRTNNTGDAKTHHKEKLEEIKNMPKPNLTRSESVNENEIGTKLKQEKALKKSKITEPGFSDDFCDCPYCQELDGQTQQADSSMEEPCPYCQESKQDDHSDCPYCQESQDSQSCDPSAEDHPEDCPYCNEDSQQNPAETRDNFEDSADDGQDFSGQGLTEPAMPKPGPEKDTSLTGQNQLPTDETNNNTMLEQQGAAPNTGDVFQEDIISGPHSDDDQSEDSLKEIASQLEDEETVSPDEENMTAEDIATGGNNMENNVSRPEDFNADEGADMGLSEEDDQESPDLANVFEEGLDNHADNIQREKVIQIVGDALGQFKGCKDILERAKEQAPQLYGASISMLRAMIEMASMLGLGQEEEQQIQQDQAEIEGQGSNTDEDGHPDYNNLFPSNGEQDQQQAPQEQAQGSQTPDYNNLFPSQAPNQDSQAGVGPGVGKLPTSATTKHVPKTPVPEGGVNSKGQKRYKDPTTGKDAFIDMKQGRVMGPRGIPVKPPQEQ